MRRNTARKYQLMFFQDVPECCSATILRDRTWKLKVLPVTRNFALCTRRRKEYMEKSKAVKFSVSISPRYPRYLKSTSFLKQNTCKYCRCRSMLNLVEKTLKTLLLEENMYKCYIAQFATHQEILPNSIQYILKNENALQLLNRIFSLNSSLQVVCDTPIARITGCV